jgi:hypothetical protein
MAMEKNHTKRSDALLVALVILFLAFVFRVFYTGKCDTRAGWLIKDAWNAIQGMLRPIFHR